MTKKLIFGLLLLANLICYAQSTPKLTIKTGSVFQLPKGYRDYGYLGDVKNGFVNVGFRPKKSISFQSFKPDLKPSKTSFLDLKLLPKGSEFGSFAIFNDKNFILYSLNEKGKGGAVFAQQINVISGTLVGKAIKLVEADFNLHLNTGGQVVLWFGPPIGGHEQNVIFFNSTDSSKFAIDVQLPKKSTKDSKNVLAYKISVFDPNLNKLWDKSYEMPYTEKKCDVFDSHLDCFGNLLMLTRVYDDNTEKNVKNDKLNFHFEIIKIGKDLSKPITIPFTFNDRFVNQLEIFEDNNKQVNICGYYGAKTVKGKIVENAKTVEGAFLLRFDNTTNQLSPTKKGMYEIPDEIIKQYESVRTQKSVDKNKNKGEGTAMRELELEKIIFSESGDIYVIGEQFYITYVTVTNGNRSYTYPVYHYEDVIIQKINAEGELAWTRKLPKSQTGMGGIKIFYTNENINIFYMDNEKNINLPADQAPAKHSTGYKGILMCASISGDGDVKKVKIKDTRQDREVIQFFEGKKVGENLFLTTSRERKNLKLVLLKFE